MGPDAGTPLDGAALLALLREAADELPSDGKRRRLVVVGGALLAWRSLRDATRDVDTVEGLDDAVRVAVRRVAERHGLSPEWVNDSASSFVPRGFVVDDDDPVLDHPRLLVVAAPLDQVLLMKVFAGRATDTDDIRRLWPHTSFRSGDDVAEAFSRAYPHEEPDPHLGAWIDEVVGDAEGG